MHFFILSLEELIRVQGIYVCNSLTFIHVSLILRPTFSF